MSTRLLDYDAETGVKTWHIFDPVTEVTALRYEQDVEPILEANKAAANDATGPMGDMARVASIPVVVQLDWYHKYGVKVWETADPGQRQAVAGLLDDPEWRYLKCRDIILGRVK